MDAAPPAAPTPDGPGTRHATVTLITGDKVTVTTYPDGSRAASAKAARGRSVVFHQTGGDDEQLYVIPADVAHLVPDRLDRALFDVAGLVDAGYDNASRGSLPVIVQGADAPTARMAAADSAEVPQIDGLGVESEEALESIGAVAAEVPPTGAPALLAALRPPERAALALSTTTEQTAAEIEKIWLDARVTATLDESVPQIGADEAFAAGITGAGVTVAVMDTGIDTTHPDLDDAVVAARDFTGEGTTADPFGHGTHVASILAGSGDASGGRYRGVAPDAELLNGRVLGADGSGTTSQVIEGFEWAAEQGADVVNVSLGSGPTDGTDPASQAVDRLSAQFGTLFVVAAGNEGLFGRLSVRAPGVATNALTVGAVDKSDVLTLFSSRGPREGDALVKPDVVAPGAGIVAARAAGLPLDPTVDDPDYRTNSGTSMAAPHVAGVAALLAQHRPELTWDQLKAIVMGSAVPGGEPVWDEGTGRVSVPAALDQTVFTEPASLAFGVLEFPQPEPSVRSLTYTNTSDADIELTLTGALEGEATPGPAPEGMLTLGAETLTVPARGTASVDVIIDPVVGEVDRFGGVVVATAADGTTIRTPVSLHNQALKHELTVSGIDLDGGTFDGFGFVTIFDVGRGVGFEESGFLFGSLDSFTIEVLPGTYSLSAHFTGVDENFQATSLTAVPVPEVVVDDDTSVVLDARDALEVTLTTHRPADLLIADFLEERTLADGSIGFVTASVAGADGPVPLYVVPSEPPTTGELTFGTHFTAAGPEGPNGTVDYLYDLVFTEDAAPADPAYHADQHTTATVTATNRTYGPTDTAVRWSRARLPGGASSQPVEVPVPMAGTVTEYLSGGDLEWSTDLFYPPVDPGLPFFVAGIGGNARYSFAAGRQFEIARGSAAHAPSAGNAEVTADFMVLSPSQFGTAEGDTLFPSFLPGETYRTALWQDGELVFDSSPFGGSPSVRVPAGGARYRLLVEGEDPSPARSISTRVRSEWEFDAAPAPEVTPGPLPDRAVPPLLDPRYEVRGLDTHNAAPQNTTVWLTVDRLAGAEPAEISGARLWWSVDDGATWTEAFVTEIPGEDTPTFVARVRVPVGSGPVSLRSEVWDDGGSTVNQEVIRAYLVR